MGIFAQVDRQSAPATAMAPQPNQGVGYGPCSEVGPLLQHEADRMRCRVSTGAARVEPPSPYGFEGDGQGDDAIEWRAA